MGKMTASGQIQLAELESFSPRIMRLNALIEQYAAAKVGQEGITQQLKRAADQLKLRFMGVGLEQLSQLCGSIVMTCGRPGAQNFKVRILRENMGALKFQLEFAMRSVTRDDAEKMKKDAAKAEAAAVKRKADNV